MVVYIKKIKNNKIKKKIKLKVKIDFLIKFYLNKNFHFKF